MVALVQPNGNKVRLPLLFDTGASYTTLRSDLFGLLGLKRWDEGTRVLLGTAGGTAFGYKYAATLALLGKTVSACPVVLIDNLPQNPLYLGLLGRDMFFGEFGFGFWESERILYVTENP